ncbi:DUF4873 domain-containing protein [Dactylosporangium sp. NPDC005572]|uniref:DUF4873 domain-containing protein n=1 Tax=Dactylosporangium sp. NPDC005572 TaxID=3156889 RepID=UPI0033A67FF8
MPEESTVVKATLLAGAESLDVTLRLSGRFDPLDGRYHWGGRATGAGVADLVRSGRRAVLLRAGGAPVPARLVEVDPWGGVRVAGTGTPPYPIDR